MAEELELRGFKSAKAAEEIWTKPIRYKSDTNLLKITISVIYCLLILNSISVNDISISVKKHFTDIEISILLKPI